MKYYIKPRLYLNEEKLWLFSDELNQMDLSQIQDGIDSGSVPDVALMLLIYGK